MQSPKRHRPRPHAGSLTARRSPACGPGRAHRCGHAPRAACRITEWVIDCADPAALAAFWAPALGHTTGEDDGDGEFVELVPPAALGPSAPTLLLLRVPEPKAVKNRVHLDLNPTDRSRDEEVQRLLGLGARRVDVGQGPLDVGDTSWVVLADPEGNESCVLSTTVSPTGESGGS